METLEEAKETIEIYKDVYYMLGTEKANKILSILTIIFTLSIPITVISSFYGMNIIMIVTRGRHNHPKCGSKMKRFGS